MLSSFLLELNIFLDHALFLTEHGFIMKMSYIIQKEMLVEIFHKQYLSIFSSVSNSSCCPNILPLIFTCLLILLYFIFLNASSIFRLFLFCYCQGKLNPLQVYIQFYLKFFWRLEKLHLACPGCFSTTSGFSVGKQLPNVRCCKNRHGSVLFACNWG